jgi:predicted  nucleic acid-binding Zn-ribbon protein
MAKKPVKVSAKKSVKAAPKAAKVVAKAKKTVKASKPTKATKPVAKRSVKPAKSVKSAPAKQKKVAKPVAKKVVKPVAKKSAKPAAKKVAKPAAKKVAKPIAKKVAKPVAKKVAKPAAKKVAKPAAKKVVKPVAKKVAKAAVKKVAKPVAKPAPVKKTAKVVAKVTKAPAPKALQQAVKIKPSAIKSVKEAPATKKETPAKEVVAKVVVAAKAKEVEVKPVPSEAPKAKAAGETKSAAKAAPKVEVVEQRFILPNGVESSRPMRPRPPKPAPDAPAKPVANPIYVPPAPDGKPGIKFAPMAVIEKPKEKSNKLEEEDMSSKTSPRLAFTESDDKKGISVESKLRALYAIQLIDSRIDKIHAMRGELPLEVGDLEDDVAGLDARLGKLNEDIKNLSDEIIGKKNGIKNSEALITKYKEQLNNVKNNREFDSLNKEIEFQELEIQLHNKRIKEFEIGLSTKQELLITTESKLNERTSDLVLKKSELDEIVASTEKEEKILRRKSDEAKKLIEERLINAYERIRSGAPNGMAVVPIEREASAGSFIQLPPQKQLDVAARKRVIVDEHSGRILVDAELANEEHERIDAELAKELK